MAYEHTPLKSMSPAFVATSADLSRGSQQRRIGSGGLSQDCPAAAAPRSDGPGRASKAPGTPDSSSTRPAPSSAPLSVGPASTCTSLMPRCARSASSACQVDPVVGTRPQHDLGAPVAQRVGAAAGVVDAEDPHGSRAAPAREPRAACAAASRRPRAAGCRVGGHQPHVEPRVVGQHGADAGQHRAGARAPGVAVGARGLAGDPLADAVGQRGAAVQRRRHLQPHPRPAALACARRSRC